MLLFTVWWFPYIPIYTNRESNVMDCSIIIPTRTTSVRIWSVPMVTCFRLYVSCDDRTNTWCSYQYMMFIPIRDVHTNTWCSYQYMMFIPVHDFHTNTWCSYQYTMFIPIHNVHTNTWCPHQYYNFQLCCYHNSFNAF